ncbi:MHC1-like protein [Orthopoxvirus akhmetapox]|uniref:MHC1-like protein n=1 Tax=Orthopoxvirus akhmetapox TaxID=2200830 RepID=A0A5J6CS10_9POXV|nr:MHC1-like protein [Akhmeta virus]QEQ49777.1 MHC1-like protein [Akhmeta virus]
MVGNRLFLDLYKNIFEEFFRLFRASISSQCDELEYYYSCDYTNNLPIIEQHYFYNGEEYTEIDGAKNATNKNLWLVSSGFRLQKSFDDDDCIIYLRSLVRRMEYSDKNRKYYRT